MDCYSDDVTIGRSGEAPTVGKSAVRRAYEQLEATAAERTVRHQFSNLVIHRFTDTEVSATSLGTMFLANAAQTDQPTAPALVQDFHDTFRKVDGIWLLKSREIDRIFAAESFRDAIQFESQGNANDA